MLSNFRSLFLWERDPIRELMSLLAHGLQLLMIFSGSFGYRPASRFSGDIVSPWLSATYSQLTVGL
jgi:hypothetical protein